MGAALAGVVEGLNPPVVESDNERVRRAARAMVDGGFPVSLAYSTNGHLVAHAAARRHGGAVSVLITFGMDPQGRSANPNRMALHHVGRGADNYAPDMLEVLRHFIGALSVAGELEGFDGWNAGADLGPPLLALDANARNTGDANLSSKMEIHSLMYERGARCGVVPPEARYCGVPVERVEAPAPLSGPALTITARTVAGAEFSDPLLGSAARDALNDNGWTTDANRSATPERVVFSAQGAELTVAVTISLAVGQTIVREYRVSPRPVVEYAVDGGGGTLTASVENGGRASTGDEVVFTALPADRFEVEEWRGDAAHCAKRMRECAVIVAGNVSVAVAFARNCVAENREPIDAATCGDCLNNTFHEDGGVCVSRPTLHYSAEPPIGGAGTVAVDAVLYTTGDRPGEFVGVGATVTFIATPAPGFYVEKWSGAACSGGDAASPGPVRCEVVVAAGSGDLNVVAVFRETSRDCAAENRAPNTGGAHLCGDCADANTPGFSENYSELRGLCLPDSGHYDEDAFSQREVCELLGGVPNEVEGSGNPAPVIGVVCGGKDAEGRDTQGVDADGTFCILDSPDLRNADNVFPCRGLFRRVLRCNLAHERPALNPFTCGPKCAANQTAQGAECRDN